MGSDGGEGVLTEDNVLPQNPSEVAEELAATQTLPTEASAALREDQVQNAVSFLNHPKVRRENVMNTAKTFHQLAAPCHPVIQREMHALIK